MQRKVTQKIREQEMRKVDKAQKIMKQLEKEMAELRRRDSEMTKLLETDDRKVTTTDYFHKTCEPVEVTLLKRMSSPPVSPRVIRLLEWYETPSDFLLVLERPTPCINLLDFLYQFGGILDELVAKGIFRQMVQAVQQCHSHGVFHGDLKLNNFLVQIDTQEVKLIDFGCGALLAEAAINGRIGTRVHSPPEYLESREIEAMPSNVWALGLMLYFMVFGGRPFRNPEDCLVEGNLHIFNTVSKGKPPCRL
ncbi:PIM2 kinase, partial [Polypterus senegalus]